MYGAAHLPPARLDHELARQRRRRLRLQGPDLYRLVQRVAGHDLQQCTALPVRHFNPSAVSGESLPAINCFRCSAPVCHCSTCDNRTLPGFQPRPEIETRMYVIPASAPRDFVQFSQTKHKPPEAPASYSNLENGQDVQGSDVSPENRRDKEQGAVADQAAGECGQKWQQSACDTLF